MTAPKRRGLALAIDTAWDWAKNYLFLFIPTLPAAATWVSAAMQNVPLWLILPVVGFVFWGFAAGMRAALEIASRVRVRNKLTAVNVEGRIGIDEQGNINGLSAAVVLVNSAPRLLQYEVTSIRTVIDGRVNPSPNYTNKGGEVSPNATAVYGDDLVPAGPLKPMVWIEGTVDVTVRYGAPGKLKYELNKRYRIAFLPADAQTLKSFNWFDL